MCAAFIVRVSASLKFRSRNKFAFGKVKMLYCHRMRMLFVGRTHRLVFGSDAGMHMPHQRTSTLFISDIIINSDIGVPSFIQNVYFIGVTPHRSTLGRKMLLASDGEPRNEEHTVNY